MKKERDSNRLDADDMCTFRLKSKTNEGLPAKYRIHFYKNAIMIYKSILSYDDDGYYKAIRKFRDKYYIQEKMVLKQDTLLAIAAMLQSHKRT